MHTASPLVPWLHFLTRFFSFSGAIFQSPGMGRPLQKAMASFFFFVTRVIYL
jgi:hypothetical protein